MVDIEPQSRPRVKEVVVGKQEEVIVSPMESVIQGRLNEIQDENLKDATKELIRTFEEVVGNTELGYEEARGKFAKALSLYSHFRNPMEFIGEWTSIPDSETGKPNEIAHVNNHNFSKRNDLLTEPMAGDYFGLTERGETVEVVAINDHAKSDSEVFDYTLAVGLTMLFENKEDAVIAYHIFRSFRDVDISELISSAQGDPNNLPEILKVAEILHRYAFESISGLSKSFNELIKDLTTNELKKSMHWDEKTKKVVRGERTDVFANSAGSVNTRFSGLVNIMRMFGHIKSNKLRPRRKIRESSLNHLVNRAEEISEIDTMSIIPHFDIDEEGNKIIISIKQYRNFLERLKKGDIAMNSINKIHI